jgi:hypothetical protein
MCLDAAEVRTGLDASGLGPIDSGAEGHGPPPPMSTIIQQCCRRFSIDVARRLLAHLLQRGRRPQPAEPDDAIINREMGRSSLRMHGAAPQVPTIERIDVKASSGAQRARPSRPPRGRASSRPSHGLGQKPNQIGRSQRKEKRRIFLEAREAYIGEWPHAPSFRHQRQCVELFRQATTSPQVDFAVCGLCTEHTNFQHLEMWTVADVDEDIGRSEWQRLLAKTPAMEVAIPTVYVIPEWNGLVLEPRGIHSAVPTTRQCSACYSQDGPCTRTFQHPALGSRVLAPHSTRQMQPPSSTGINTDNDAKGPVAMDERSDDASHSAPLPHLPDRCCPRDPWTDRWHSAARGPFINICNDCQGDLLHSKGARVPLCSMANHMWIPGPEMTAHLPVLSWAEEALICIYRLKLNVIRLKAISNIHQRGLIGTSSAFVHDVASVFATLPQPLSELDQSIRIMFMGKMADPDKDIVRKLVRS